MKTHLFLCSCFAAILLLFSSIVKAEVSSTYETVIVKVGMQPMAIFPDNPSSCDVFNVICAGIDLDFNGNIDEGDEKMSWWKLKNVAAANPNNPMGEIEAVKVMDFDIVGLTNFPYRGHNKSNDKSLYICYNDYVLSYDVVTAEILDTIKIAGAKAVSTNDDNLCFISVREYEKPGDYIPIDNYVVIYNVDTKSIIDTIKTGNLVQETLCYFDDVAQEERLAILCEGGNSELEFYSLNNFEKLNSIPLGKNGNDIFYIKLKINQPPFTGSFQLILVVINGEHKVISVDANKMSTDIPVFEALGISTFIDLPTTGYNGPREISGTSENKLCITAYDGNVYIVDPFKDTMEILKTNGTPESVYGAFLKNDANINFAFTDIYTIPGTYIASNEVEFVYNNNGNIKNHENNCTIYPNPVVDNVTAYLPENFGINVTSEIFDINGRKVQTIENINVLDDNSINFNINSNLAKGIYYINFISNDNNNIKVKFIKD